MTREIDVSIKRLQAIDVTVERGLRGPRGTSLEGTQNEDGTVTVEEVDADGERTEVGVIAPPDVESKVILPSGNTQVTMTSGASFEVQRGQRGVSVADILQDGGTLEVVLTDDTSKPFDLSPLISDAVDVVATQVTDARDAAQAAAQGAEGHATTAEGHATASGEAASAAQGSATSAQESADSASSSATAAQEAQSGAESAQTAAAESASEAASSASGAADSKASAEQSASDALAAAEEAGKSAYEIWLEDPDNNGTREDFFAFLRGEPGPPGDISNHDRLSYDGQTLSQQAEAGQTEPLERWQDPSGNDVSRVSSEGDLSGRSLSLGVPVQATNELNPNAFYTSGADRLYSAARRFEVWHDSPNTRGWDNGYSPFENRFGDCIKTKDDDGQRFTRLYIQVGEVFDSGLDFWLQTTTGGRRPVAIRVGILGLDGEVIGWGDNGAYSHEDEACKASHVGNGLWNIRAGTQDQNGHSGWVIEYELDLETQSEIRTGAVQAFGPPPNTQFEWEAASLTKHTAPELHKRWQWGENVRIDPEDGLEMRDEATGDWTPITLNDGQLQVG